MKNKKVHTLDLYLGFSLLVLIAYTVVTLVIFAKSGSEPTVLTGCIFAAFAGEIWCCAWIKKLKLHKEYQLKENDEKEEIPKVESDISAFG